MLLLMAGGVVGGLANHFPLVLAARVAEGLAAGIVQPIPAIIILRAFEPGEQGRASGIFGMGVVLAPALGPSIGGVLVDLFGWRSIFFMVVPFCLASLYMAYRFVPVTSPGGVAANRGGAPLDWRGLLLGSAGTLCLLNGLVELHGHSATRAAGLLACAAAALVAFVWWQRRLLGSGREALMNLGVFSHRQFAMGSIVAFIYGTALFGSTYLLPVYLQLGLQLSASHVGALLLPSGFVLALTIAGVGRLADRQPTYLLVSIGLALLAASFAVMVLVDTTTALWVLVAFAILVLLAESMLTLFADDESAVWVRYMVREQAEPTEAYDRIYTGFMQPMLAAVRHLVGILLELDANCERVRLRTLSLVGSLIVYRVGRATILREMEWSAVGPAEVAAIRSIAGELVASIRPIREIAT